MNLLASEIAVALSARIRELRIARGLTQRQLAERVGSHRAIVGRVERGRHALSLEGAVRYAVALRVDPTDILYVIDDVTDRTIGALSTPESRAASVLTRAPRRSRIERSPGRVLDAWNDAKGVA